MLKIKKNSIKKFIASALIVLMLVSTLAISVSAIQRKSGSDGPLSGYLADNNSQSGGWVAYGDSISSQTGSITASVSVTYHYNGSDNYASGSGSGSTAAYAVSSSTPSGSVFKRESSSHSAAIGANRYSVPLSY